MTDETEPPPGNLVPAVIEPRPAPSRLELIVDAIVNALSPDDFALMTMEVRDIVGDRKSAAARVAAAKLLFDRLVPENLEQNQRETEERNDAIADAKIIMAEFAALKHAGLQGAAQLAPDRPPGADHAAGEP